MKFPAKSGYVVVAPRMNMDNIELLSSFMEKSGGIFVSPQGASEGKILQMGPDNKIIEMSVDEIFDRENS